MHFSFSFRLTKAASACRPTPAPHGPPMDSPGLSIGSAKKAVQPIAALNPYNMNWTIKARLVKKGPKRSFSKGSTQSTSVFSVELVDEQVCLPPCPKLDHL